ncbi:MAG: A/G-specific adenine glycosylase [Sediminicola sp.]|jgi:A/G-specific adenine glycosylase|tara:strand:+ start:1092 stop:2180 length:1089 start_codon:yes stop_codon:yes gene_type:complete
MIKNTSFFYKKLIQWYLQNKRDLPWRKTKNPYFIWLSEIMLQQTRVAQGLPYYEKFVNAFPEVEDLANASEENVLKLWQGLGYYSRARNLHFSAKLVAYELDGVFPNNYKDLLKLKGVGDYTASAIASFCYDEATAVVDGNVYRVLARYFGIETPINSALGIRDFKLLAQQLMDKTQPGTYNQAIMEFGARYCVPQNPDCNSCIFNDKCIALSTKKVGFLPVKLKKTKIRKRFFNYIVVNSEDQQTVLKQRTSKGIWMRLFEFPLIETDADIDSMQLTKLDEYVRLEKELQIESLILFNEKVIIHKLSHQHLYTKFWIAESKKLSITSSDFALQGVPIERVADYAVPVLIENFISEFSVFKI